VEGLLLRYLPLSTVQRRLLSIEDSSKLNIQPLKKNFEDWASKIAATKRFRDDNFDIEKQKSKPRFTKLSKPGDSHDQVDELSRPYHLKMEKTKSLQEARKVFKEMIANKVEPNILTYNRLMHLCTTHREPEKALEVFNELKQRGIKPSEVSYTTILNACSKSGNTVQVHKLLKEMEKEGVKLTVFIFNTAMNVYVKAGNLVEAKALLRKMKENKVAPDAITFNTLINICATALDLKSALEFLRTMLVYEKPNHVTYSVVLKCCAEVRDLNTAEKLYTEMQMYKVNPNHITLGTMINTAARVGNWEKALYYFENLKERKLEVDIVKYGSVLTALAAAGKWEKALELKAEVESRGMELGIIRYCSIIKALRNGGLANRALEMVEEAKNKCGSTTLLKVMQLQIYVDICDPVSAQNIFNELIKDKRALNEVNCSLLLRVWALAGRCEMVDVILNTMHKRWGIKPNLPCYGAIIDGLWAAGLEKDAYKFFIKGYEEDGVIPIWHETAKNVLDLHIRSTSVATCAVLFALSRDLARTTPPEIVVGRSVKKYEISENKVGRVREAVEKILNRLDLKHHLINKGGAFVLERGLTEEEAGRVLSFIS